MTFKKGQSGNPGGRPAHQTKYLKSLVRLVKTDDWKAVVLKAIDQAKRGDKAARDWLSGYVVGKAQQSIDITTAGEKIVDAGQYDRSISALADAVREIIHGQSTQPDGDMDTTEQTTVASTSNEG